MPPIKKSNIKGVYPVRKELVELIKNDWVTLGTASLKFKVTKSDEDDKRIVDLSEIKHIFNVEKNTLFFKAFSSKLLSHWKKVLANTCETDKEFSEEMKMVTDIISMETFYCLYNIVLPLLLECYRIGKQYYVREDYNTAIVWFRHSLSIFKSSSAHPSETPKYKIWFLFEYLANSLRKVGQHREAYNAVVEGLVRHTSCAEEAGCLEQAVLRWSLITRDVLATQKQPKYITLASGFQRFLSKTPSLSTSTILQAELGLLERTNDSCYYAYHEAVLQQLEAEYSSSKQSAESLRVLIKRSSRLKLLHNDTIGAVAMVDGALADCGVSEGLKLLHAQLLVHKFTLTLPSNNTELDISRQMKELDALQNKEETSESPVDSETNTCIQDDCLLTSECDIDPLIMAYDLYKVTLASSGCIMDEFDLEQLKLLACLLQLHQHRSTSSCLLLLLRQGMRAEHGATLLWSACRFLYFLLHKHHVLASLTFMRDLEALLKDSLAPSLLATECTALWLQFLVCKSLVLMRNQQTQELLACLRQVPLVFEAIKHKSIAVNHTAARLYQLLWWSLDCMDVQTRGDVVSILAPLPILSEATQILKHSPGTQVFWACAASRCLNSLVHCFFEHTKNATWPERLAMVCQLAEWNVVVGGSFVRVGVAREAQGYLIQALAFCRTFRLKHRMCECMLALVHLSCLQNFLADSRYHLSVLHKSLFTSHQRHFDDIELRNRNKAKDNTVNVVSEDVVGNNARKVRPMLKSTSSSRLTQSTIQKTPLKKEARGPRMGFKVYEEEVGKEKKEGRKVRGSRKGGSVTEEDFGLSVKPLQLDYQENEESSPSKGAQAEVAAVPDCWSFVDQRNAGSKVCGDCSDVLMGRRLQLLKLVADCEVAVVADRDAEVVMRSIEKLEECKSGLVEAADRQMEGELGWEDVCALQNTSVLMFEESFEGRFEGVFKGALLFHEAFVHLKLLKLKTSLRMGEARVLRVLQECRLEVASLQSEVGMAGVVAEIAAQINLVAFSLTFQWPSRMQGYLSEMTLICSAVGRLPTYQEETTEPTLDDILPLLPTPMKTKKASLAASGIGPEAPVKKGRKPRMPTLQLSDPPSQQLHHLSLLDQPHHDAAAPTAIGSLVEAISGIQTDPSFLTYRSLCISVALTCEDELSMAHYLTEAVSVSLRHNSLFVFAKKIRYLEQEIQALKKTTTRSSSLSTTATCEAEGKESQRRSVERMMSFVGFSWCPLTLQQSFKHLPSDWTVCQVSSVGLEGVDRSQLVVTIINSTHSPLNIPLPHMTHKQRREYLERFEWVKKECRNNMTVTSKRDWWDKMMQLDGQLEELLDDLEKEWMSCWRGALLGGLLHGEDEKRLQTEVDKFLKLCPFVAPSKRPLIKVFLSGADGLEVRYILQALHYLSTAPPPPLQQLKRYVAGVQAICKRLNLAAASRGPVILILDKDIQHLPFENLPSLRKQSFTRQLSYHSMIGQLVCSMDDSILKRGVDRNSVFYVINPENNLPNTENMFLDWFQKSGWEGVAGEAPSASHLSSLLSSKDLFIYTGHGSGSKYLDGGSLQMLQCRSGAILMGCSSGRLWAHGALEPVGMLTHYFLAGSACVLANLWEVTDKDINRYTQALLTSWLHSSLSIPLSPPLPISSQLSDSTTSSSSLSPQSTSQHPCTLKGMENPPDPSSSLPTKPSKLSLRKKASSRKHVVLPGGDLDDKENKPNNTNINTKINNNTKGKKQIKNKSNNKNSLASPSTATTTSPSSLQQQTSSLQQSESIQQQQQPFASEDWLGSSVLASRGACKLRFLNGAAPVIYGFPIVRRS